VHGDPPSSELDRRTFLKGATVVGASVLAASVLSACDDGAAGLPAAHSFDPRDLSNGEISAICSNLAKACEKQLLLDQMTAFSALASYFKAKTVASGSQTLTEMSSMLKNDLDSTLSTAKTAAEANADRGAMRSLVWNERVSTATKVLLDRYDAEGNDLFENKKVFVCEICGYVLVDKELPDVCPVCKVPKFRISLV